MKCPYCNSELEENSKFCCGCGMRILSDPTEGAKNPEDTQPLMKALDTGGPSLYPKCDKGSESGKRLCNVCRKRTKRNRWIGAACAVVVLTMMLISFDRNIPKAEAAPTGTANVLTGNVAESLVVEERAENVLYDGEIPWSFDEKTGSLTLDKSNFIEDYAIGDRAFGGCAELVSVTIPEGVTAIGNAAFAECKNLKSASIPASVTSIDAFAFEGCSSLSNVEIQNGLTRIGLMSFANCATLTDITIPESILYVGNAAFSGCTGLTAVHYTGSPKQWNSLLIRDANDVLSSALQFEEHEETARSNVSGSLFGEYLEEHNMQNWCFALFDLNQDGINEMIVTPYDLDYGRNSLVLCALSEDGQRVNSWNLYSWLVGCLYDAKNHSVVVDAEGSTAYEVTAVSLYGDNLSVRRMGYIYSPQSFHQLGDLECYYYDYDEELPGGEDVKVEITRGFIKRPDSQFLDWDAMRRNIISQQEFRAWLDYYESLKGIKANTIENVTKWMPTYNPKTATAERRIAQLSAGGYHTLALWSDGTVNAIGRNVEAQCKTSQWVDVVKVAAGGKHSVALRKDGNVYAIGLDKDGQCEPGNLKNRGEFADWKNIVDIDAHNWHTIG